MAGPSNLGPFGWVVDEPEVTHGGSGGGSGGGSTDIAFATVVPLTFDGNAYMPIQTVNAAYTFTAASGAVRNALVVLPMIADGNSAHVPDFSAFWESNSSSGWDNTTGIYNLVQFWFDGSYKWVSIFQQIGAQPVAAAASAVTLARSAASAVIGTPVTITVGTNNPLIGSETESVTLSSNVAGAWSVNPVVVNAGTPTATSVFTPSAAGAATFTGTAVGTPALSNGTIGYTVLAAATAPDTMAAPVATGGDTIATVVLTAPDDNGAAISGYTVTSNPAGGVDTDAGTTALSHDITGLTNGVAYTFSATATNSEGTSPASPASNSVTPAAAAALQFAQLSDVDKTGSSPDFVYSGTAGTNTYTGYGVLNATFPTGDATVAMRCLQRTNNFIIGLTTSAAPVGFASMPYAIYNDTGLDYNTITAGGVVSGNGTSGKYEDDDSIRLQRVGATLTASFKRTGSSTWVVYQTWSGVPATAFHIQLAINTGVVIDQVSGTGLI